MNTLSKGKVILAGAGPGDPDLISLKAVNYLKKADKVLVDRLVSPQIIEQHTHPSTEIIYVGKQCSKGIHTPQKDINELMVKYAQMGKLVVRLKGGDASLFSNILDELEHLKKNGISYEIIPGISAAFGAAAYSAIPLTARGFSRGVRFLTLYDLDKVSPKQWEDWVETSDTLVFYMSGQKLNDLAEQLLSYQISSDKGIAVIQQATTPYQKTQVFSVNKIKSEKLPEFEFVPTLIIVGKVTQLHEQYAWYNETPNSESYFDNHKINLLYAG